jgi:hypothetical protein
MATPWYATAYRRPQALKEYGFPKQGTFTYHTETLMHTATQILRPGRHDCFNSCLHRNTVLLGAIASNLQIGSPTKAKEGIVGSRQYNELPASCVLFHHPMSISNLIQLESLGHRNLQRACLDLIYQLLQRSLHKVFWTTRVRREAH